MKQAAKICAQNGLKVETVPVPIKDKVSGRNRVGEVELYIDDELIASHKIDKWLKEAEYLEDFVMLVERMKTSPNGNSTPNQSGGMTTLKRGRIGGEIREKIIEDYDNGMPVEALASKYERTKLAIEKVLKEGLAAV